ncbi:MAG: hypothetical protein MUC65_04395 [Pontiellaceae bacterium]|nr:hypothetical protein [Pontiellaceae bacterium]
MSRNETKERLRQDIAIWFADGVIDAATLEVLQERYESRRFGWVGVVKYIGITGGLLAFFGIIGMITAMVQSGAFAAIVLGGVGGGITYWGLRLSGDIGNRYAVSSKVVLTLGVLLWTSAIGLLADVIGMKEGRVLLVTGLICLPVGFFLAYRSRNPYLLIVALLGLYHWIGSWNEMWGRSTYEFSVQDPQVMSLAAFFGIVIGVYHERKLYPKTGRFYLAWESMGLLYLNMSLLILSIWGFQEASPLVWILVFTAFTLAQLVWGAMCQNGLFRGFGITFFAINVFTRYHELFWERLYLGQYLLAGGGILLILGVCTEVVVRALRRKGGAA